LEKRPSSERFAAAQAPQRLHVSRCFVCGAPSESADLKGGSSPRPTR
jgi:hypothetical protein